MVSNSIVPATEVELSLNEGESAEELDTRGDIEGAMSDAVRTAMTAGRTEAGTSTSPTSATRAATTTESDSDATEVTVGSGFSYSG